MNTMELPKDPSRRLFLVGTAIGSAVTAIAATGTKALAATEPAKPSESVPREISDHVRKYYRSTRI
jgi:hypothetical protein